jgi:hypothetical protein
MIAIAPDPAHTHLSLLFDQTVEAIQLAAQSENYVVDRYWLPWDLGPKTDWADYDSVQSASQDQKEKEEQPGLLLFRWNGKQEKPEGKQKKPEKGKQKKLEKGQTRTAPVLYVFLVSDTSTVGINGRQFNKAVRYVGEVCAKNSGSSGGCAGSDTIHIMGPTFSGSLASLRRLADARSPQKFTAYSGTVSSLCAQDNQRLLANQELRGKALSLCGSGPAYEQEDTLTFKSFVTSTEVALEQLVTVLIQDRDIKCDGTPQVAILSEAATTYGAVSKPAGGNQQDCYTKFYYPREIASLRNASPAAPSPGPASANNPGAASPYLSLNLADQTNRSDEPPDFSSVQGPLSKEAVLMNYAAEMRRNHYKYIGITGTNILDVLFLATFLRSAVPDARLFLLNSDLLLERDLDNAPYIGTLAVTTYPLILRNLDWSSRRQGLTRLPFPDQVEEGQYNASLLTIAEITPPEMRSSAAPLECGDPPCPRALPMWLTAVGTGGYWPIQTLEASGSKDPLERSDFSGAWTIIAVFLWALGVLHCGVLLRAWPFSATFRDFSLLGAQPGQRLFFIHTASASLVLALVMTAMPAWRSSLQPLLGTILGWMIVGVLATCALLQINYLLRWREERREPETASGKEVVLQVFSFVAVWTVAAALIGAWTTLFAGGSSDYAVFFAYRAVHLATGLSPLTPMLPLLAAVYLWALGEVWRLRFNDQVRPRLNPSDAPDNPKLDKLRPGVRREQPIARSISDYLLNPAYSVCFLIILAAWFFFFDPRHAFDLFERPAFGWLYECLFYIVVAMILSSGFRMAQIWLELKKLLLEINRSLLRFTFSQLKETGWSPIWRQGSEDAEWGYMVRSLEVVRQLGQDKSDSTASLKDGEAVIATTVGAIRETRDKLQSKAVFLPAFRASLEYLGLVKPENRVVDDYRSLQKDIHKIQDSLADTLGKALDILQISWRTRNPEPKAAADSQASSHPVVVYCCEKQSQDERRVVAYRYEEDSEPEKERQKLLEKYVALRYVAFIRAVLGRIRLILIFLAISFTLLLVSLNVYSFEPHQALIWSITAIFGVIGLISLLVLMQVHRDPILSNITGTEPNELGLSFYVRIVSLGALPLLTLMSTHFPAIGRSLVSFLQPGLEALK